MRIGRNKALRIINSLKSGQPCEEFVEEYSSKETKVLCDLKECLDTVAGADFSVVRFLKGDYGSGKSHTLLRLKNRALKMGRLGFLVSKVEISRQHPFSYIERTVSEIIKEIKVRGMGKREEKTGLQVAVENWVKRQDPASLLKKAGDLPFLPTFPDLRKVLLNLISAIGLPGHAVRKGYNIVELCLSWLDGRGLRAEERKILGIRENVTKENARRLLVGLARVFRGMGYKGWLLIVDEQEAVSTLLTPRQRNYAFSNLRMIIDSKSDVEGIMWVFASTPEFFDSQKGIKSYEALNQRINRGDVLEVDVLQRDDLKEISQKVLRIYRIAYPDWADISDISLDYAVTRVAEFEGAAKPRLLVSALVGAFDEIRKARGGDFEATFAKAFNRAYENWGQLIKRSKE